ncbi:hypothetical protein HGRIS_002870 [Hohenbuehelia grisea]|uniref:DUF6729 domain-containing protein n=1 Tax=Hohenbuehelia grisea TaxID=104357 RepID=A0ABR3JMI4_9AGAR
MSQAQRPTETSSTRGGARPGAGRKSYAQRNPTTRPPLTLSVSGTPGIIHPFFLRSGRSASVPSAPPLDALGALPTGSGSDEATLEPGPKPADAPPVSTPANARTSRLFWDEDQADTDLLIEDSLLDGLEEPDDTLNALKSQIAKHKRPDCYRERTFWVRPRDPIFALDHAWATTPRFSPTELYHLPVFVWLPDFIPDRQIASNVQSYNSNPIARRVRSLHSDYFLLTNRYRCPETAIAEAGCGASFQGSDPVILAQLPRISSKRFQVSYLTARSAIDKPLVALMQPLFAGRFGPDPLASTLAEMRHLRHAELELTYLAAASHQKITDPPSFSEFSDKSAYAGTQPSVQFCKSVFVDYSRALQTRDHTFKITKYMARLGSQPTHTAFYTVLNEDEQIRGQALTLTKSLSLVRDIYSAAGELSFHELATTSLNENVAHIEADPYTHLPAFHLPPNPFRVVCYETATTIDSACYSILSLLPEHDSSQIVLGFDVKFDSATPSAIAALSGPAPRVHVIQIAYMGKIAASWRPWCQSYQDVPGQTRFHDHHWGPERLSNFQGTHWRDGALERLGSSDSQ